MTSKKKPAVTLSSGEESQPGGGKPSKKSAERLLVEVSDTIHWQVKVRAALASKDIKSYLVDVIDNRGGSVQPGPPIEAARHKKRLVADLPTEKMEQTRKRAEELGMTLREFILRCLEADGILLK